MARIKPNETQSAQGPTQSAREHLTEAPTLLPTIIFQDLVFGAELGSGSFSTVKFCKHIQRGQPASNWPEYAAKVIRSQLMRELGYEAAVRREIAVLRQLKHVSIARLVASFRWRDDVYLLLEYASRGDLHSLIRRIGSLAVPNAKFIFAEVSVGLSAVHDLGYAFADLKPENIIITASGHAKLTDFGAARPLPGHTAAAAAIASARKVIIELRDGDWSARAKAAEAKGAKLTAEGAKSTAEGASGAQAASAVAHVAGSGGDGDCGDCGGGGGGGGGEGCEGGDGDGSDDDADYDDERLEGTAMYLSPELVRGSRPTATSDSWAFGCTLFQALCGRPPLWAETHSAIMRSIVTFREESLEETFSPTVPADARDLVCACLKLAANERIGGGGGGMGEVQKHGFFEGVVFETLYAQTPPPLAQGAVKPAPNAAWTRRHNSMMWSPLPQRYAFDESLSKLPAVVETHIEAGAPFVGRLAPLFEAPPIAE